MDWMCSNWAAPPVFRRYVSLTDKLQHDVSTFLGLVFPVARMPAKSCFFSVERKRLPKHICNIQASCIACCHVGAN